MATNFPASLDSLTNPTSSDGLNSPSHSGQHADANDAIEALQAKVGVDGSAVSTSLDYRVGGVEALPFSAQTASYTLVLSDAGSIVEMNVATANTLTIPTDASVSFAVGTQILIYQKGAGQTTVTPDTGVTLVSNGSKFKIAGQHAVGCLVKYATDTWILFGNVSV